MECADAFRNNATHGAPPACPAGQQPVRCVAKGYRGSSPAYTCAPAGSDATQHCHAPAHATGKAHNVGK